MTHADVLSHQRQELERCALRREKSLRTLFGVSLAFLGLDEGVGGAAYDSETRERELSAFLDNNDIFLNRPFDASTLPSLQRSRPLENGHSRPAATRHQKPRQTFSDASSSPTQHNKAAIVHKEASDGQSLRPDLAALSSASSVVANSSTPSSNGAILDPPPSRPSDDGSLSNNILIDTGPQAWEIVGDNRGQGSETTGPSFGASDPLQEKANHPTPPDSGRSVYAPSEGGSAEPSSKAHADDSKKSYHTATPATPDEQLRFEEAQSMQRSGVTNQSRQPETVLGADGSDLPSQFIEDAYGDGTAMMNLPPIGDESILKQQGGEETEQDKTETLLTSGLRNSSFAGISGGAPQDPTISRRPPICIDTSMPSSSTGSNTGLSKHQASVSESATPSKSAPLSSNAQSPPERMTTRVSSGALRHKSVSEILGETPKATPTSNDNRSDAPEGSTPKPSPAFTASDPTAFRLRLSDAKERDRSKLSTVVFTKQQFSAGSRTSDFTQSQHSEGEDQPAEQRDYFLTFFAAQAFTPPRAPPLSALLKTAHKTLATTDHYIEFREKQDFRVLGQIKDMQTMGRWSLRQPERAAEPQRPVVHWDVLLGHVKWMNTDFREERKFKLAGAKHLAEVCALWVSSSDKDRKALQVEAREGHIQPCTTSASPTPELVNDEASEATEDELAIDNPTLTDPPAAIFSLPPDVFIFGLNKSPISEKILLELPCYDPAKEIHQSALGAASIDPDSHWRRKLVPVSKYAEGKLVSRDEGPPQKKTRLEAYETSVGALTRYHVEESTPLAPLDRGVALFHPDNKHIRDRIHAGHAFRPPSEHQMPSRDFFECRSPSQWTVAEDDELRRLVREYAYNWSLISSCLSSSSLFSSGAERRTPWECFERWISLEGLPAEMSKVPYFRTYHQRLQQAARAYEARQQALLQQQGGNAAQLPLRRRTNQPYTVEKRKNNKPIHLIEAMRKHAKKNEAAQHKQQQGASLAAMRKATELPKERQKIYTPREYSRLKYERQMKVEEQNRQLRIQFQNAKRAAAQHQAGQQGTAMPQNRNMVSGMPAGNSPGMAAAPPQLRGVGSDAARAMPQIPRPINGQVNGIVPTNGQGVPHAAMQPQMQMPIGQRGPPNDPRLIQEAQRVQAEQQAYLQHQQRQQRLPQPNGQAGSPTMQNLNPLPQSNSAMLASMQGHSSPAVTATHTPQMTGTSPRMNHSQPQSLSSGMTPAVNQIHTQLKLRHPTASPGEISRLTTEQLFRLSQQSIQQTAMAAAVGNSGGSMSALQTPNPLLQQQQAMMPNGNTGGFNHQQYAQYMRSQQANQARDSNSGTAPVMNGSRSATPLVQRTGSAQGGAAGRGPSQSPRPGPVGIAGAQ